MGYSAQQLGKWQTWAPTFNGWGSSPTVHYARYCIIGNQCTIMISVAATTSNATTKSFTLPVVPSAIMTANMISNNVWHTNNGAAEANSGRVDILVGSITANLYRDGAATAWTASGTCQFKAVLTYEV